MLTVLTILLCCMVTKPVVAADLEVYEKETTQDQETANLIPKETTGLIIGKSLTVGKNGQNLGVSGYTQGSKSVVKCGFTKIIIQRKKPEQNVWNNYKVYNHLYAKGSKYLLSKSIRVTKEYQYRVKAIHYAKSSKLTVQRMNTVIKYLEF